MAGAKPHSPSELYAAIGTEPHPGQTSRSRIALRHRLVVSVFRAVRDRPFAGMFYWTERRLSGAEGLDRRQRLHALPPFPHGREVGVHGPPFGRPVEGESAWQQVIVGQPYLAAEQKTLPVRQLALHDLKADRDLRQCMRDDLLVGGDAERPRTCCSFRYCI
jgi:hypothetical protein